MPGKFLAIVGEVILNPTGYMFDIYLPVLRFHSFEVKYYSIDASKNDG